ncbi:hypothetical protein [uncultured Duncaniella sp.]|uniref:hypothetical protein n=1 Tax=uncultured Duncaniella sp. TaxID=2768039 RepID=UPI0025F4A922|nr:hypothetical protein [uncultured Duncaniella sp.]
MKKHCKLKKIILISLVLFTSCTEEMTISMDKCGESQSNVIMDMDNRLYDLGEIVPYYEDIIMDTNRDISENENDIFGDIEGMEVNIVVRENVANSKARFLSSNGAGKEVGLAESGENKKQKFRINLNPISSSIYITDNNNCILSIGKFSNDPSKTKVLYARDDNSQLGGLWSFLKGRKRPQSNILENTAEVFGWGEPGGAYYEVLGVKDSRLYFNRYFESATQEFEIRLIENLRMLGSPRYNISDASVDLEPDKVISTSVNNETRNSQKHTFTFADSFVETSSFQENKSYTSNVSGGASFKILGFGADGKVTETTSQSFTYGENSSHNISYTFTQELIVSPRSEATLTAVIKSGTISCDYSMDVEGVESGRRFTIFGRWEGISCIKVHYTLTEKSLDTGEVIGSNSFEKMPTR